MRRRSSRLLYNFFENLVKVGGESMPALVDVDGWFEGFDVYCLVDASFGPVMFVSENGGIFSSEVVVVFTCVLEHG